MGRPGFDLGEGEIELGLGIHGERGITRMPHRDADALFDRARDQFDRLYEEGQESARIMAIAVHPYISGVPHRIKYFEAVYDYIRRKKGVWMTTGEEIYEWFKRGR